MIPSMATKITGPDHFVDAAKMVNTTPKTPDYDHVVHDLDMVCQLRIGDIS